MRVGVEKLGCVEHILRDADIYPYLTDDGSPDEAAFTCKAILDNPACYTLMPNPGSVFLFMPHNFVLYEVHCAILPNWRGIQAVEASKGTRDWMFANTPCQKIITVCPAYNTRAYALARRSGMVVVGVITKAFLKDRRLVDLILLSVGKGE